MTPRVSVAEDRVEKRRRATAIGNRIRALRAERGMTQAQVAGDRFTKAYISALETGAAAPSMRALAYVAGQLRVPPEWFLSDQVPGEQVALPATISRARFADGRVYIELDDGRAIGMPLSRSRRLMSARVEQLDGWEVTEFGRAIAWPALGEEIGLEDFLGLRVLAPDETPDRLMLAPASSGSAERRPPPAPQRRGRRGGTYAPLTEWLARQSGPELSVSFDNVEAALRKPLPPSARRYAAPWSSATSPLAKAVHSAGWRASADLANGRATFRRVRVPGGTRVPGAAQTTG